MSAHSITAVERALLALSDAHGIAELCGHPSAGPLALLAQAFREHRDDPDSELVATTLTTWAVGGQR